MAVERSSRVDAERILFDLKVLTHPRMPEGEHEYRAELQERILVAVRELDVVGRRYLKGMIRKGQLPHTDFIGKVNKELSVSLRGSHAKPDEIELQMAREAVAHGEPAREVVTPKVPQRRVGASNADKQTTPEPVARREPDKKDGEKPPEQKPDEKVEKRFGEDEVRVFSDGRRRLFMKVPESQERRSRVMSFGRGVAAEDGFWKTPEAVWLAFVRTASCMRKTGITNLAELDQIDFRYTLGLNGYYMAHGGESNFMRMLQELLDATTEKPAA